MVTILKTNVPVKVGSQTVLADLVDLGNGTTAYQLDFSSGSPPTVLESNVAVNLMSQPLLADLVDLGDGTTAYQLKPSGGGGGNALLLATSPSGVLSTLPAITTISGGALLYVLNGTTDNQITYQNLFNSIGPMPSVPYWDSTTLAAWIAGGTWDNQLGASVSAQPGYALMTLPDMGDNNEVVVFYRTAPATPYTLTSCITFLSCQRRYTASGVCFRESGSGKVISSGAETINDGDIPSFLIRTWTTAASYNGELLNATEYGGLAATTVWWRITDDGANRYYYFSIDGVNFNQIFTDTHTNFLTADQIGIFFVAQTPVGVNAGISTVMAVRSWVIT